jgi:hypothetical protein
MNISKHRICWIPKFLSENEKNSTYIIYLKYIKQNTELKLMNIFQASWEMFSRNSLKCPILNLKNIFKKSNCKP